MRYGYGGVAQNRKPKLQKPKEIDTLMKHVKILLLAVLTIVAASATVWLC